jgi:hypothetical protein
MVKSIRVEPQRGFEASVADVSLYKAVAEGTAEKFGDSSRAYQTIMNGIDSKTGTGSQFFFNTEAGLYLPKGKRVARFDDLSRVYGADSTFFEGFYTDTSEIVLRSDTLSRKENRQILENLVAQVKERGLEFSPENPLVLSGLRFVRDDSKDNHYGILLEMGDSTVAVNDPRFDYRKDTITFGNHSVKLWTKKEELSRVYFNGDGSVRSSNGDGRGSSGNGRVVVFDAEGVVSENLEFQTIEKNYQTELRQLREKIDVKLSQTPN